MGNGSNMISSSESPHGKDTTSSEPITGNGLLVLKLEDRIRVLEQTLLPFALYAFENGPDWYNNASVYYGRKKPGRAQVKYSDYGRALQVMKDKLRED